MASLKSAGLPMIRSSTATKVSAASMTLSGYICATDIPFRTAFQSVSSRNVRSTSVLSVARCETVSNSKPASVSNAARLGEHDANTNEERTLQQRYGFGETDGPAFFLRKMSGSLVSLKSLGTINSLSLIGSSLTEVIVVVISVG